MQLLFKTFETLESPEIGAKVEKRMYGCMVCLMHEIDVVTPRRDDLIDLAKALDMLLSSDLGPDKSN